VGAADNEEMGDPCLDQLPRAYRIGLLLRDLGASDDLIAECLEIDPQSVVTLLEIGARKLESARLGTRLTDPASNQSSERPA